MLCTTGIQLSADIILTVYSLYRARKERDNVKLFSNVYTFQSYYYYLKFFIHGSLSTYFY
jgi:hypothetical protein